MKTIKQCLALEHTIKLSRNFNSKEATYLRTETIEGEEYVIAHSDFCDEDEPEHRFLKSVWLSWPLWDYTEYLKDMPKLYTKGTLYTLKGERVSGVEYIGDGIWTKGEESYQLSDITFIQWSDGQVEIKRSLDIINERIYAANNLIGNIMDKFRMKGIVLLCDESEAASIGGKLPNNEESIRNFILNLSRLLLQSAERFETLDENTQTCFDSLMKAVALTTEVLIEKREKEQIQPVILSSQIGDC